MTGVTLDFPPELVERIAERAAEIVAERMGASGGEAGEWLRGADRIAAYLGCSPSRVYALHSARRLPVEKDGAAIVARRSDLDVWVREGGDRCP
jgi:hypothetical protein